MATYGIPFNMVRSTGYMVAWVDEVGDGRNPLRLETYTGWIGVMMEGGSILEHNRLKAYLPVETGKSVRFYPDVPVGSKQNGAIVNTTVMAALGAVAEAEEEANIFAVDTASVALEHQHLTGIEGAPQCLILTAEIGLLRSTIYNFSYAVNVLTRPGGGVVTHDLPDSGLIPADSRPIGGYPLH
ncbi:hypothetical protein [Streptomyces echinatus]|uniref:Uncharacterized protein n=1 Tax=Streptomyces echinatus TaxID=67293 RepID=A0A7W9UUY6_9ACTN|nr:hypothetical protein [Streptomyces echinatus]MBB5932205.1 hypothetical protein [Streptomyces echinatus]